MLFVFFIPDPIFILDSWFKICHQNAAPLVTYANNKNDTQHNNAENSNKTLIHIFKLFGFGIQHLDAQTISW